MKNKECIIIGSGLGGLSCGVMLALNGFQVTILEQHFQIGGCLQCFTRKGAKFETGMHFIGSAAPGQTLDKLMRYLRLEDIELNQLDSNAYDIVSLAGEEFRFANGREAFIEQMGGYFPKEKENLIKYFNIIEQVSQASALHSLRYAENEVMVNTYYQTVSINEVLDNLFQDELLKNVLVGNLPLYSAEKDKTPFSQHAFIMDFYNQSAFRVVGGSDAIAKSLAKTIKENGGNIRLRSKVTKIICDETKAIGVEINSSEFLKADLIIAAIHPTRVMEMLDTKLIRPAFKNRLSNLKNTAAGFSVYLKFKESMVPYLNSNYYSFRDKTPWGCENYTSSNWPLGYLYMHFCDEPHQKFASSGVLLSYMNMADVEKWKGTIIGKRGDDYERFKREKAERLLEEVEKNFPGFKDSLDCYYTSTPLSYQDYTGTQDGSMYGVAKDITLGAACRVPHKTKIPNLFLTGQNINSHGMLGVLVGSIVTCSELLTSEHIYQQIIEVNK